MCLVNKWAFDLNQSCIGCHLNKLPKQGNYMLSKFIVNPKIYEWIPNMIEEIQVVNIKVINNI